MSFKVLLLVSICCGPLIAQIKARCIINIPLNATLRPIYLRNYASAAALIPHDNWKISLNAYENIKVYCPNTFKSPSGNFKEIAIQCYDNLIRITDRYGNRQSTHSTFECEPYTGYETCNIQLSSAQAARPKIFKKIGTRRIQLSPSRQTITINKHQKVTAQCDTKFKSPTHQETELNLICLGSRTVALGHPIDSSYSNFECELSKWNLYESKPAFPWCPSTMASYIVARPLAENDYEYLAGICYDFEQMSFKSIYYAAKSKFEKHLAPRYLDAFEPQMEVTDIEENFISKKSYVFDNPQMLKWFSFSNYKIGSIFQSPNMHIEFIKQFDQLLNIDWWPGLKQGNWQLYEEALAKHVENENQEYDILAGISRYVAVPIRKENCSKNITMVDIVDSGNNKLPLYVWNYLRSSINSSDDVVVIGVNTPLSDFYDEKQLLFCNDICHTIDWLSNVLMSFHYRPMGIIFCCTVDEVLASARLDGFAVPAELITPTMLPILNYEALIENTTTTNAMTEAVELDETTVSEQEYDEYGNPY